MAKTAKEAAVKTTAPTAPRKSGAGTEAVTEAGTDPVRFEASLAELEALVERLEQGDLPLEESLATFERGIHLSRDCQKALDQAEQRVRILTEASSNAEPAPFEPIAS